MKGLLREVGRARRAMGQLTASGERIEAFSVKLEDLPLLRAGDSFVLLTGGPGVDVAIARQVGQVDRASIPVDDPATRSVGPARSAGPARGGQRRSWSVADGRQTRTESTSDQDFGEPRPMGARDERAGHAPAGGQGHPITPRIKSATALAQRFERVGLKAAWEAAFHKTVGPPAVVPSTATAGTGAAIPRAPTVGTGAAIAGMPTAETGAANASAPMAGTGPAILAAHSQLLLRAVERAERAGRARTPAWERPGTRRVRIEVEERRSAPYRRLTPDEREKLRAVAATAFAADAASRQWPDPDGVTPDRGRDAASDDEAPRRVAPEPALGLPTDAVPRERWVAPIGSGLRRLASLAGVQAGDAAREDPGPVPLSAGPPRREWPLGEDAPAIGAGDFTARLEEVLRAEALRSGIDPEELIR